MTTLLIIWSLVNLGIILGPTTPTPIETFGSLTGNSQRFTFDKSIVKTKPESGRIRFNNIKSGAATELYVSLNNFEGKAIKAWVESFPNGFGIAKTGSWIRVFSRANPLVFTTWEVTEYVENAEKYLQIKVSGGKPLEALFTETVGDLVLEFYFELPKGGSLGQILARAGERAGEWVSKLAELEITKTFTLKGVIRYRVEVMELTEAVIETLTPPELTSMLALVPTLNVEIHSFNMIGGGPETSFYFVNKSEFKITLVNESVKGVGLHFELPGKANYVIEPFRSVQFSEIAGGLVMIGNS